ncbi:MAG: NCS2 family permease [Verrucomicrobia bacterium]|nr:NCS2 family permease [Verrucomicrobiota bacterium]
MEKSLRREILAGISTFLTLAYLLVLYPQILSEGGIEIGSALTATIVTLAAATIFLAFYADFPAVLAPGLSAGPFLVYGVILKQGASWQTALGLVFWGGLILFLLSLLKIRQKLLLHIPATLKTAAISGIGLFLIVVGCKDLGLPTLSEKSGLAFLGLFFFFLLHRLKVESAFLIAILSSWIIGLITGLATWNGLTAWPPSLSPTFLHLDLLGALRPEFWGSLLTLVLISLIDSSASLTVLSHLSHKVDESGHIQKIDRIVIPDGIGSMFAALLGTGTLSFLLESSSGIKAGGRTKTVALTAALCSLSCLFLYPLISSIPLFATAPALIAIGIFMALEAKKIPWSDWSQWIPALITIITMPLAFSIYLGFVFGFISYVLIQILHGKWRHIDPICWALSFLFILQWTIERLQ